MFANYQLLHLQFPLLLDMAPYTAEGIAQLEEGRDTTEKKQYELVGIVVHSGQASAGHYYAFVKEKRLVFMACTAVHAIFLLCLSLALQLHSRLLMVHPMNYVWLTPYCLSSLCTISCKSVLPGVEGGAPVETRQGRWLRFNDTLVDEFVLNDNALESECFGGSYKSKSDST